jgi:hypothetical protein
MDSNFFERQINWGLTNRLTFLGKSVLEARRRKIIHFGVHEKGKLM